MRERSGKRPPCHSSWPRPTSAGASAHPEVGSRRRRAPSPRFLLAGCPAAVFHRDAWHSCAREPSRWNRVIRILGGPRQRRCVAGLGWAPRFCDVVQGITARRSIECRAPLLSPQARAGVPPAFFRPALHLTASVGARFAAPRCSKPAGVGCESLRARVRTRVVSVCLAFWPQNSPPLD